MSKLRPALFTFAMLAGAIHAEAAGTGLTGSYYNNTAFTGTAVTRADAAINFTWTGTPGPAGIGSDNFAVRWEGQIEAQFSEEYTFHVTADDGARLWVDDQLLCGRVVNAGELAGVIRLEAGRRYNLRLELIEKTGTARATLAWSSANTPKQIVPTAQLYPTPVTPERGSILMEQWNGLAGTAISALTTGANYPTKPSERDSLITFESLAQDVGENFGTKVSGFIVPAVSGNYTFATAASDTAELWLSTDDTAANKVKIVTVASATAFRQFTNTSGPIALSAGAKYYVELLHKAGTGADHFSVAWQKPGSAAFEVIDADSLVPGGLTTATPAQGSYLNTLATGHPRVLISRARLERLKALIATGADAKVNTWWTSVKNSADSVLTLPVNTYVPDDRGTILGISRSIYDRIYKLALAYHVTGNSQYAERAYLELEKAANPTGDTSAGSFPDWHPAHFLDVAEMTHAFCIGFDWLYDYWTPARRDVLRTAITTRGLTPGMSQYNANAGWTQPTNNNWNLVCTGGLTLGALAIAGENAADTTLVEQILHNSVTKVAPVMKHYTTDNGGWYEGPGYWDFATEYNVRMMAALESALGSDFNLSDTTALWQTGDFPTYITGPTKVSYNFADSGAGNLRGCQLFWLARRFNKPNYAWYERTNGTGEVLDLLWYDTRGIDPLTTALPLDTWFRGATASTSFSVQDVVTLRSGWQDTNATFLATKAGEVGVSHGNLEAGGFVLDALGTRWAQDFGGDNYALPGYFSEPQRWTYYRLRAEGNNCLVINPTSGVDQVDGAITAVTLFASQPDSERAATVMDLTPAYSGTTKVWRGFALSDRRRNVLIQDEITTNTAANVWWFMHIGSDKTVSIDPDGTAVMLTKGANRLWLKIVAGGGAFQLMDAVPLPTSPNPAGQNANTGHKKLAINLTGVTNTTLAVYAVPLTAGQNPPEILPTITPLGTWSTNGDAPPLAPGGLATGPEAGPVDVDLRSYASDGETAPDNLRFSVADAVNGTVTLLPDGHTARFSPMANYTGIPTFKYTVTDSRPDPRTLVAYDFDPPDAALATTAPDLSGNLRDGTIDFAAAGTFQLLNDKPSLLGGQGTRSINLVEDGTNATRVNRAVTATELNWNTADWTVAGWFKRRDTSNDDMVWHISDGDGFGSNNEIYVNCPSGSSTVRLQHYEGTAFDVDLVASGITAGVWHHFAVVRSGTTLSFYVNGALVGSDSTFTFALNQNSPLVFGGHANPAFQPGRWFDGQLDDCAVYTAALSAGEIGTLAGGMTVRHFGGASSTGTISIGATLSTSLWTAAATGSALNWSNGANWQSASAPASSRGATLDFFTGRTLAAGAVASNNDTTGGFTLNALTLGGTSSGAATVAIGGNTLRLRSNATLNPVVNLSASAGSGLLYDITAAVVLEADTTFQGSGTATFRISGDISGAGALSKTGTSTLILAGTNTYTGPTTLSGTLQIGADGATGTLGLGNVINNGTLRFDRTGTLLVPNDISGTGTVYIDCPINAGTVVLSGTNTFTGNVTVNSGTLRITKSSSLGSGTKLINLTQGTSGNVQLRLDGSAGNITLPATFTFNTSNAAGTIFNEAGSNTINGNFTLTGGGGATKIVVTSGSLTLAGNLAPNTTSRTLELAGAGFGSITGNVTDGVSPNTLVVTKSDVGTWTLSGANAWTGNTNVNAGTLVMNGSLTAGGTVTVATAAKLAGSGAIAANTTINGTHQPGDGLGAQTFTGALAYGSASRFAWELGANTTSGAGTNFDQVIANTVTITTNASIDLVLNRLGSAVSFNDAFWGLARSWTLVSATGITGTFKLGTISADAAGRAVTGFGAFSLQHTATAVNLVWTPAPAFQQWQAAQFGPNWNNASVAGSTANPDGDRFTNQQEYVLGSSALSFSPETLLAITPSAGNQAQLSFTALRAEGAGYTGLTRRYTVEWTTDLANAASWQAVSGFAAIAGNNQTVTLSESIAGARRFYRVVAWLE